jgi:hypothetical protein
VSGIRTHHLGVRASEALLRCASIVIG